MMRQLFQHIEYIVQQKIKKIVSVSGGDISDAYKIQTDSNIYFLKINNKNNALRMFEAERSGLEKIRATSTIAVPEIFACGEFQGDAFLLMEFVESKYPSEKDYAMLGKKLAMLHGQTNDSFGLNKDNFIGSLPQRNTPHNSWRDFYIKERLLPQLNIALQKHLLSKKDCPDEKILSNNLIELFRDVQPSLVHGDLWNGNFVIAKDGTPYLIDPAVYYGHHEVDMAMSKLFGGFGDAFYETHQQFFPVDSYTADRIEIYQLYYLLVHLNLFGSGYSSSVKPVLKKYF